jgi:hypothetical protein
LIGIEDQSITGANIMQARALGEAMRIAPVNKSTLWRGVKTWRSIFGEGGVERRVGHEFTVDVLPFSSRAREARRWRGPIIGISPPSAGAGYIMIKPGGARALPTGASGKAFAREAEALVSGRFRITAVRKLQNGRPVVTIERVSPRPKAQTPDWIAEAERGGQ